MSTRWDLAGYDKGNNLILVVEAKTKLGASPDWAAQLRRNIFAHGVYPNAPYFLMAFPDKFYLWVNTQDTRSIEQPTYEIDARPLLQPYFDEVGISPDQITGSSFELILAAWLNKIIQLNDHPENISTTEQWLLDSGLYHALTGGSLDYEVVV
jgi:hypothetical protein